MQEERLLIISLHPPWCLSEFHPIEIGVDLHQVALAPTLTRQQSQKYRGLRRNRRAQKQKSVVTVVNVIISIVHMIIRTNGILVLVGLDVKITNAVPHMLRNENNNVFMMIAVKKGNAKSCIQIDELTNALRELNVAIGIAQSSIHHLVFSRVLIKKTVRI